MRKPYDVGVSAAKAVEAANSLEDLVIHKSFNRGNSFCGYGSVAKRISEATKLEDLIIRHAPKGHRTYIYNCPTSAQVLHALRKPVTIKQLEWGLEMTEPQVRESIKFLRKKGHNIVTTQRGQSRIYQEL